MRGFFVLVFYLKVTLLVNIPTVTIIHTCVSPNGVKNENNVHKVGMFTQVSVKVNLILYRARQSLRASAR